ncbi:hypothetical protein D5S17_09295 [Pseudonocardiaceae bacterium YIM PH 21723]|nr:hypothetical protein D5S17_09295 [Pseudonocardiaceae bacterium YIM PH 21723]
MDYPLTVDDRLGGGFVIVEITRAGLAGLDPQCFDCEGFFDRDQPVIHTRQQDEDPQEDGYYFCKHCAHHRKTARAVFDNPNRALRPSDPRIEHKILRLHQIINQKARRPALRNAAKRALDTIYSDLGRDPDTDELTRYGRLTNPQIWTDTSYLDNDELTVRQIADRIRADLAVTREAGKLPAEQLAEIRIADPIADIPDQIIIRVRLTDNGTVITTDISNIPEGWGYTVDHLGIPRYTPESIALLEAVTDIVGAYSWERTCCGKTTSRYLTNINMYPLLRSPIPAPEREA